MKNQTITLKNEAGESMTRSFSNMAEAANWCAEYPDYGITLELDNDGYCWDSRQWQIALDDAFSHNQDIEK